MTTDHTQSSSGAERPSMADSTQFSEMLETQFSEMLDVLSRRPRRRILFRLLRENDLHNPQDDDSPQIPDDVEINDENLNSLEIAMTHTHLPKLEEHGFIEWERKTNAIRQGPRFEEIQPLLELMQNHADELPDGCL